MALSSTPGAQNPLQGSRIASGAPQPSKMQGFSNGTSPKQTFQDKNAGAGRPAGN